MYPNIPNAEPSDGDRRVMLLLVGAPFTGKTTAAVTFPKPLVFDFDHKCPAGIPTLPFWKAEFCDKYARRSNPNHPPNKRDALMNFLRTDYHNLPADLTLIFDSGTAIEKAFHTQSEVVETPPISPKTRQPDGFYVWKKKLEYFSALLDIMKVYPGNVIYIMHEQYERDEDGRATGVLRPLMSGSFVDSIASHFTLMFRQRVEAKQVDPAKRFIWDVLPTPVFPSNNCLQIKQSPLPATYESLRPYMNPGAPASQVSQ